MTFIRLFTTIILLHSTSSLFAQTPVYHHALTMRWGAENQFEQALYDYEYGMVHQLESLKDGIHYWHYHSKRLGNNGIAQIARIENGTIDSTVTTWWPTGELCAVEEYSQGTCTSRQEWWSTIAIETTEEYDSYERKGKKVIFPYRVRSKWEMINGQLLLIERKTVDDFYTVKAGTGEDVFLTKKYQHFHTFENGLLVRETSVDRQDGGIEQHTTYDYTTNRKQSYESRLADTYQYQTVAAIAPERLVLQSKYYDGDQLSIEFTLIDSAALRYKFFHYHWDDTTRKRYETDLIRGNDCYIPDGYEYNFSDFYPNRADTSSISYFEDGERVYLCTPFHGDTIWGPDNTKQYLGYSYGIFQPQLEGLNQRLLDWEGVEFDQPFQTLGLRIQSETNGFYYSMGWQQILPQRKRSTLTTARITGNQWDLDLGYNLLNHRYKADFILGGTINSSKLKLKRTPTEGEITRHWNGSFNAGYFGAIGFSGGHFALQLYGGYRWDLGKFGWDQKKGPEQSLGNTSQRGIFAGVSFKILVDDSSERTYPIHY